MAASTAPSAAAPALALPLAPALPVQVSAVMLPEPWAEYNWGFESATGEASTLNLLDEIPQATYSSRDGGGVVHSDSRANEGGEADLQALREAVMVQDDTPPGDPQPG